MLTKNALVLGVSLVRNAEGLQLSQWDANEHEVEVEGDAIIDGYQPSENGKIVMDDSFLVLKQQREERNVIGKEEDVIGIIDQQLFRPSKRWARHDDEGVINLESEYEHHTHHANGMISGRDGKTINHKDSSLLQLTEHTSKKIGGNMIVGMGGTVNLQIEDDVARDEEIGYGGEGAGLKERQEFLQPEQHERFAKEEECQHDEAIDLLSSRIGGNSIIGNDNLDGSRLLEGGGLIGGGMGGLRGVMSDHFDGGIDRFDQSRHLQIDDALDLENPVQAQLENVGTKNQIHADSTGECCNEDGCGGGACAGGCCAEETPVAKSDSAEKPNEVTLEVVSAFLQTSKGNVESIHPVSKKDIAYPSKEEALELLNDDGEMQARSASVGTPLVAQIVAQKGAQIAGQQMMGAVIMGPQIGDSILGGSHTTQQMIPNTLGDPSLDNSLGSPTITTDDGNLMQTDGTDQQHVTTLGGKLKLSAADNCCGKGGGDCFGCNDGNDVGKNGDNRKKNGKRDNHSKDDLSRDNVSKDNRNRNENRNIEEEDEKKNIEKESHPVDELHDELPHENNQEVQNEDNGSREDEDNQNESENGSRQDKDGNGDGEDKSENGKEGHEGRVDHDGGKEGGKKNNGEEDASNHANNPMSNSDDESLSKVSSDSTTMMVTDRNPDAEPRPSTNSGELENPDTKIDREKVKALPTQQKTPETQSSVTPYIIGALIMACMGWLAHWASASTREKYVFVIAGVLSLFSIVVMGGLSFLAPGLLPSIGKQVRGGLRQLKRATGSMRRTMSNISKSVTSSINEFKSSHPDWFGADGMILDGGNHVPVDEDFKEKLYQEDELRGELGDSAFEDEMITREAKFRLAEKKEMKITDETKLDGATRPTMLNDKRYLKKAVHSDTAIEKSQKQIADNKKVQQERERLLAARESRKRSLRGANGALNISKGGEALKNPKVKAALKKAEQSAIVGMEAGSFMEFRAWHMFWDQIKQLV